MDFLRKKRVYCDSAATTPLDKGVARAMRKSERFFENPSSIYLNGALVRKKIEDLRARFARANSVRAEEIIFTSGGTESNNLAIKGVINNFLKEGFLPEKLHIITSEIEHSSVLQTFETLEKFGIRITKIPVDEKGLVKISELKKAITDDTFLVSIMYVNNETGTVEPLHDISLIVKEEKERRMSKNIETPIYFHTDASQAPLSLNCLPHGLGVDLMTFDAHKIYGPKGVGALYVKSGTKLSPILDGGGQERGLRGSTESLSLITGLVEAFLLAKTSRERFILNMRKVRKEFISELARVLPKAQVNGSEKDVVPHIVNVYFPNIDAEFTVLKLDAKGVACATKSSCMKDEEESYVIYAMSKDHTRAKQSLRFSFLRDMTLGEARQVASILKSVVK